ncbi:MAG TPA: hypothetical protein PKC62_02610 [Ferruginibacter sp.]|nr:hypothetical protein [Ferruginibacter sp.]
MAHLYRFCFLLLFFSLSEMGIAQKITGKWEGKMGDERLQMNITQKGAQICGYTYDYVLVNPGSYCKAKFSGYLDRETNTWYLRGTKFFENSGGHVLMRLAVWREKTDPPNKLRVTVSTGSFMDDIFGSREEVILTRVSLTPNNFPDGEIPCFNEVKRPRPVPTKPNTPKPPKPAPKKPIIKKSLPTKPAPKPLPPKPQPKPKPPVIKKDSIEKPKPKPITPEINEPNLVKKMTDRRQSEQSRIAISTNHLNIKVYDNGEIDNDTVSIFYNKKLLISHKRLSTIPIELNIELDPNTSIHEITLYADNLGSIPPNTALVVVTAGKRHYELRSKSSLDENAVLVFEYKPSGNDEK